VILVDSSIWIDYLNGTTNPKTELLDKLLGNESLAIGDLILTEVLQGLTDKREFDTARRMLMSLDFVELWASMSLSRLQRTFVHYVSSALRFARPSIR
jgi:predicted nucleic acid-binding protein